MNVSSNVIQHRIELYVLFDGDVWLCGGQSNMSGKAIDQAPASDGRKGFQAPSYD
jgi:hypothetical protein